MGGRTDCRPPIGRILFGAAAVEKMQRDRSETVGHDPAGRRYHRHLRTPGSEVDGHYELLGLAGDRTHGRSIPGSSHALIIQIMACRNVPSSSNSKGVPSPTLPPVPTSSGGVVTTERASTSRPIRDRKDRKSTRLNSSHLGISYAVFCLK